MYGYLEEAMVVGAVTILADNNSTPKVGTTIHTIMEATYIGNVHILNIVENCGNLVGNSFIRLSLHSISSVVRENNAGLCDTHSTRFTARRNVRGTVTAYGGRNVRNIIIVNNSNSFENTHSLSREKVPYMNVPNAVSGSVTYYSCAVNCSAYLGAVVRYISGMESAARSRSHYAIIRIVKHHTNCLTLGTNVTINTATVLVPRVRFSVRGSIVREVGHARLTGGGRFLVIITRNINISMARLTNRVRRGANIRSHTYVLNRVRHNNSPAIRSHIVTAHVNGCTIGRLLVGGVNGHIITSRGNSIISCSVFRTLGVGGRVSRRLCRITVRISV